MLPGTVGPTQPEKQKKKKPGRKTDDSAETTKAFYTPISLDYRLNGISLVSQGSRLLTIKTSLFPSSSLPQRLEPHSESQDPLPIS